MMRKLFILMSSVLLVSCSSSRFGAVNRLCKGNISKTSQTGICVYDLDRKKVVYEYNADHRMRPASCMKVLTAIASLQYLGSEYIYTPHVDNKGWGWCWDDVETNTVPWEASQQYTVGSAIVPMLKNSDNMMAESIFHQLSSPYSRAGSAGRINIMLNAAGVDTMHCKIADGSGLSLYNYVTPRALVKALIYAHNNDEIYKKLYAALPVAGVDGTLRKRMKGTPAAKNVHAKTGTVTGVVSLAGYYRASNGHNMCFSIINQGIHTSGVGRNFQDSICVLLCK
ncbi:MAG: D-alanyl-D-alanine carboxypeptidase/D-alanyl-D-alanine-endopeptidase [Bacteroidaceae bacterium]|nr:D-alanyl-D-alanine carboxypeptidase/D-alanyl-D-alanine-endopeptidase [Bacteroidaceae bacterium]